jgi:hypothetical protein
MGKAGWGMRMYLLPCPWWGECTHGQGGLGDENVVTALHLVGRMYPWAGRVGGCEYTYCPAVGRMYLRGRGDENVPTHPPDHLPQVSLCEMPPPQPLPYRPNRVGPLPRIP